MRKNFILFAVVFLLAACSSPGAQVITPSFLSPYQYSTPGITPTIEFTGRQTPSIKRVTPLLTRLTFTPTFDANTIITVTPAPQAYCPKENPDQPVFQICVDGGCYMPDSETILNYLNSGGILDKIKNMGKIADFTGDSVKELLTYSIGKISVYGCDKGKYKILQEFQGTQRTPQLDYVGDLNNNGIPELIVVYAERHAFLFIRIFEWNGSEFVSLIKINVNSYVYDWAGGVAFEYEVSDINNDGVKEIVGVDDELSTYEGLPRIPLRRITTILAWNGKNYVVMSAEPSRPVYRFQAIQDGDYEVSLGQYEKALNLYHEAISNDKLEWWSRERHEFEVYTALNSFFDEHFRSLPIALTKTPTPFPTMPAVTPDTTEYPRLAAYAYYRTMLIYFVQGNTAEAEMVYKTLQQKFGDDQYGLPYAEMATAFWNAYQASQNITNACGSAIEYVTEHPDILVPLGGDYHGSQSKIYKPEDVCPF